MNSIQVKKEFNAPIDQVFDLLSKHSTYNVAFAPIQVVRVKDAADPERHGAADVSHHGADPSGGGRFRRPQRHPAAYSGLHGLFHVFCGIVGRCRLGRGRGWRRGRCGSRSRQQNTQPIGAASSSYRSIHWRRQGPLMRPGQTACSSAAIRISTGRLLAVSTKPSGNWRRHSGRISISIRRGLSVNVISRKCWSSSMCSEKSRRMSSMSRTSAHWSLRRRGLRSRCIRMPH